MNKYIQEYISKQKKQNHEDNKMSLADVINKLQIGKKEYLSESDGASTTKYPYYDMEKNEYYGYNVGEVSDEEYKELLKYVPEDAKPDGISRGKMSFWYGFAILLMVVCVIGGIIVALDEDASLGIGIIIGSMVLFSQIILLSKIEYNTRKN